MSKFIGADASARHRQTLAQMYQAADSIAGLPGDPKTYRFGGGGIDPMIKGS